MTLETSESNERIQPKSIPKELHQKVLACCFRMTGNWQDAEDSVQEAMLAFVKHPPPDSDKIEPWLFKVAQNKAIDVIRRRKDTVNYDDATVLHNSKLTVSSQIATGDFSFETEEILSQFLKLLDPREHCVMSMHLGLGEHLWEEYSQAEISAVTGLTIDQVRGVISRCMKKLMDLWTGNDMKLTQPQNHDIWRAIRDDIISLSNREFTEKINEFVECTDTQFDTSSISHILNHGVTKKGQPLKNWQRRAFALLCVQHDNTENRERLASIIAADFDQNLTEAGLVVAAFWREMYVNI